ncbi:MAG TPA: hypothetical protein ENL08_02460 [Bacteroidetes bacterium]|nr:hypothetical protein [Bacteroidota bacterium]
MKNIFRFVLVLLLPVMLAAISCSKDNGTKNIAGPQDQFDIFGIRALSSLHQVTIWFETDLPAKAVIEYDTDRDNLNDAEYDTSMFIKLHEVNIYELSEDTGYYFRIRAWTVDSLEAVSDVVFFQTPNPNDLPVGPIISGLQVVNITSSGATVTWNTDINADSRAYWGVSSDVLTDSTLREELTTEHSVMLTGLEPETNYNVQVASEDDVGNRNYSHIERFTTLEEENGGRVTINDVRVLYTTGSTTAIFWTTDMEADSRILWGEARNYLPWFQTDLTATYRHILKIDSLTELTTYFFRVSSQDDQSTAFSDTLQFTTTGNLTLTAPDTSISAGDTLIYGLELTNASELHGLSVNLVYDNAYLEALNFRPGPFTRENDHMFFEIDHDRLSGQVTIDITWNVIFDTEDTSLPVGTNADGGGVVALITFLTNFSGEAAININQAQCSAYDVYVQRISMSCISGTVTVEAGE